MPYDISDAKRDFNNLNQRTSYYTSNKIVPASDIPIASTEVITSVQELSENLGVSEGVFGECFLDVYFGNEVRSVEIPCYPEEISDSTEANFPLQSVIGSSSPLASYVGTGARSISFSLLIHREMERGSMEMLYELFRASVYPMYSGSAVIPPISKFVFGRFGVKGVVTSCNFNWKKPVINREYNWCDISVNIYGLPMKIVDVKDLGYSMDPFKNSSMPNFNSTLW